MFFSIFPSPDQELNPSLLPAAHNTGGSLPDLTNIQFPPPLSTPLDPEDTVAFPSLSSSNSTGSLTTNLTHLGISAASHGNNYYFMSVRWEDKRRKCFPFLFYEQCRTQHILETVTKSYKISKL